MSGGQRIGFQIIADGGGDLLFVDHESHPEGKIRHYRSDYGECPIEYESVNSLVRTVCRAYKVGAIYINDMGRLDLDDDRYADVARVENPSVDWWQ